jgi:hypothetical protein
MSNEFGAADIQSMILGVGGRPITSGGHTTLGLPQDEFRSVGEASEFLRGFGSAAVEPGFVLVAIEADSLGSIKAGDSVVWDTVTYKVRRVEPSEDPATQRLHLSLGVH